MNEIKAIVRFNFHPGNVKEWKRLIEQEMEIARTKDRGTLQFEVFFNEDESEAIVFERYRDSDAAMEHLENISHLLKPIMAAGSVSGEVLGTPNAELRKRLKQGQLYYPWMVVPTTAKLPST